MNKIFTALILTSIFAASGQVFANTYYYQNSQEKYMNIAKKPSDKTNGSQVIYKPSVNNSQPDKSENIFVPQIPDVSEEQNFQKNNSNSLKKLYKNISNNVNIINACELLKNTAGNFSYKSLHGENRTKQPVKIIFSTFSKEDLKKAQDAFGEFEKNYYVIKINSDYKNSPIQALASIIARESLVSKNKSDSDIEAGIQMQTAIWKQLKESTPILDYSTDPLAVILNRTAEKYSYNDYGSFYKQTEIPVKNSSKEKTISNNNENKKNNYIKKLTNFDFRKQQGTDLLPNDNETDVISFDSSALKKKYKKVTDEDRIIEALELLKDSIGKFSYDAIMGYNITKHPIQIKFKNLEELNPKYASFDALGWQQNKSLTIYINDKHFDAPAGALAAILSHEALHQDKFDSLNEETYAWTMEASVWTQMCDKHPELEGISHPLVSRENILKKLLEKGDYTKKYIKKSVFSNPSYSTLPTRSPGFEDD